MPPHAALGAACCSTVMALLTEDQLDRYEAFRRSSLREPMRRVSAG
jgi:hypothetical protein